MHAERIQVQTEAGTSASLNDAMLLTGFGLYNVRHVLLCGCVLMGVIMQSLALGQVLPAARCDLQLNTQQMGLLAAVPYAAIVLTSYVWGWLADVRGRRRVMLISMPANVVFCLAASFAPEPISFAVLVFLSAVFVSGPTAVIYTYLGEMNNDQHRDKMVAFGSSFIGTGTVALPGTYSLILKASAISWLILSLEFALPIPILNILYRPWRLLFFTCALPVAISFILLCFSPESPKYLYSQGRDEECLAVLKKVFAVNKGKSEDTFPVKSLIKSVTETTTNEKKPSGIIAVLKSMRDQTVPLFKKPLLPWTCLASFVQFGIFAATNGFFVWFPTILNAMAANEQDTRICKILHRSKNVTVNVMAICDDTINTSTFQQSIYIGLVFTSMYFIVAFLVDCVGKKSLLVVTLVVTGTSGALAHLVPSKIAVALFAVFQMSGACIGLMNAVAVELFPTRYRALAVCLAMLMGRAGSIIGSTFIGLLLEVKCELAFYLFGGLVIVNGLSCLTLPGKKSCRKETDKNNAIQCS